MSHLKSPPNVDQIDTLEKMNLPFPTSIEHILETVRSHNVDQGVMSLLKEFSPTTSFSSSSELMSSLRNLAVLMSEEIKAPHEKLASPQD